LTVCRDCVANGLDHDEVVDLCKSSPLWTGILLCGLDWLDNPFHKAVDRWFLERYNAGKRRFVIITPRGHLKTSYFGIALLTWRCLVEPEDRVLYMMASKENSDETLDFVKDSLANNESLAHFFPERVLQYGSPDTRSKAGVLKLPRSGKYKDPTIKASGMDAKVTGGHYTWHVFDDLIDETMVDSEVMQRKCVNFTKRSNPLFVNPDKDMRIVIGTRWPGEFYNWLLDPDGIIFQTHETLLLGCYVDHRFREFLESVDSVTILEDGDPVWPRNERVGFGFTMGGLDGVRAESEYDFIHQYLNQEVSDEMRRFRKEDIKYFSWTTNKFGKRCVMVKNDADTFVVPIDKLYISMTVDPATGEGKNTDESAITVCGHDRASGLIFVLAAWDGRVTAFDLINKILDMAEEWNPNVVSPEDVSFQKTLKWYLKKTMLERGIHFPIRPVKPGTKSKGARIVDSLQPFVRNQQVNFTKGQRKLVNELLNLQVVGGKVVGRSPNLADSLAYHVEYWRGKARPQAKPDIDWFDSHKAELGRAYGIECQT